MLGQLVVLSANCMTYRKKLIEVSMPLEAINQESAREKSIRHGHPSTLHLWWARRPLAACRAVLFASLVDDPSAHPDKFPTEEEQQAERQRLHDLIGKIETVGNKQIVRGLVSWDDIKTDETGTSPIIEAAQKEIARCLAWENNHEPPTKPEAVRKYLEKYAPPVYDPFCGGGSIPLEAQRLGIEAHGSDLNPVAVLITKALIEIPPKFKDQSPVNPEARKQLIPPAPLNKGGIWWGAQGLAEDVRYYGKWMRDEAEKRIGHLYPQVKLPKEYGGDEATVIAWLWARTVKCPNPACGCQMPLVSSFNLSTKKGKEAWIQPIIDRSQQPPVVNFEVKTGKGTPPEPPKVGRGAKFRCLVCNQIASEKDIRAEFIAKRNNAQLIAIVAEGDKGRIYLPPSEQHLAIAMSAKPEWKPEEEMNQETSNLVSGRGYGITHWHEIFTPRQLVALTTFSDLVKEARERIKEDAVAAEMTDDSLSINEGGIGTRAYADAIATYLAFAVDKAANYWSTICAWHSGRDIIVSTFGRQAIPMVWDYAETNPLSNSTGNFSVGIDWIATVIENSPGHSQGFVKQIDATTSNIYKKSIVVSTDPPYYDNIGYADLSDFFYVWLRRSLSSIYPDLFSTLLVPKEPELVATPYRFGGSKQKAKEFFETGLNKAFERMRKMASDKYPLTIYYAFKQTETETSPRPDEHPSPSRRGEGGEVKASTGWETMLEGLIQAGFSITGTLPMRTELTTNLKKNVSALASSIALVCRPRPDDAPSATRRQFLKQLQTEFPTDLATLQQGNIAPVDLAQASIGLGMSVFSRYSKVLEADGSPMRVRTALQIINSYIDEFLNEQEGEFDPDTRWALTWFEQYQFEAGQYGDAETLSKAKNTSIKGLEDAGILIAKNGKVRLLKREELPKTWNPAKDDRTPDWEATQHLIQTLDKQGETGAAKLLAQLADKGEICRDLAYRLYVICDRQGWTQEAISYNSLVTSWSEITRLAAMEQQSGKMVQGELAV
jgi:putative DNA methylase